MKSESTRPPVKHELDHLIPTVIHHPDEDKPALAKWIDHAMENQTRFWGGIVSIVAGLIFLVVVYNAIANRQGESDIAWTKLETAKSASERLDVAKDYPNTPAALAALMQAASDYYVQGLGGLPNERDVALPKLKQALDLYKRIETDAPAESPQARVAALGVARTYEARNELERAIKQYEKVSTNTAWAKTEEAIEAGRLAKLLQQPESVAFYKSLYAYKPAPATLPPGGIDRLNIPMPFDSPLPGSGSGFRGSAVPSLNDLMNLPPPPSATRPAEKGDLPADPFAAPTAPAKDETKPSNDSIPPLPSTPTSPTSKDEPKSAPAPK